MDLLLRDVKNPAQCVREEYARQKSSGEFRNLYTGRLEDGPRVGCGGGRLVRWR